ncbi:plastocyanin [Roseateles puraquae]|uniref:plastocyanin n=1 Tax=Roseateles puraquae TaxID=431059 RepID=UPI0031CE2109
MRPLPCVHAFLTTSLLVLATATPAADLSVRVLDKSGQPLADAVVLVDSAVPGSQPPPVMEATIRQEKMRFKPYVTVVHTGARVSFTNLDAWDHHVILGSVGPGGFYLDATQNQQMRLAGKVGETVARDSRVVAKPGAYLLGCHLHSSMRGHLYVADSPWSRVSEADGQAVLTGLPAGPARVRIWHPDQVLEGAPTAVEVGAGGSAVTVNTAIITARRR